MTHKMISGFANASEIFIVFLNWVFLYIHTNTHATKANKHATKTNNYVIRLDNKYNAKKIWKKSMKEIKNRCQTHKDERFFF